MADPGRLGLTLAPPLIGVITGGGKYWQTLKKAEREQVLRLRREIQGNLNALTFSRYDRKPPLAIATPDFYTLAGNLAASAAFEALAANYTAKRPPRPGYCGVAADRAGGCFTIQGDRA
jgi:hypothetical protein